MTHPDPAVVDVVDLSRLFGARTAVDRLTFSLTAGEVVVLLGPNGAGKTTTLRMLAGLIAPSSGRGTVAGAHLGRGPQQALRASVGLLTETPGLWDSLSVWTNLVTYARLYGVDDAPGRVREVLAQLGLGDRADDAAAQLSKGLRQRVALARAVLHRPRLLLLDEPTSGLDPAAASDVRQVIAGLRDDGAAVLVCTHNLAEADQLGDRIGVLNTRLVALDTPAGLRRRLDGAAGVAIDVEGAAAVWLPTVAPLCAEAVAAGATLRLEIGPPAGVPEVVAALVAAGARVSAVRPASRSLEEAYLALVNGDG
jgi:ABC-2 type transport system ATP-binding protein